ncbi:MAG: hypothetical protein ACRENE_21185 [Polyangiaceae bacterium]
MKSTLGPYAAAAVVLGAAGWALVHNQGPVPEPAPAQAAAPDPASPHETTPAIPSEAFLPAGHPAIPSGAPGAAGATGAMGGPAMGAGSAADATIRWTAPGVWQAAPNPNGMRLATYHPSPAVDVSVSRAGGSTDANIERWVHQFEEASPPKRTDSKVKGLDVHAVEVSGTYASGGMMGGTPQMHEGWSLVGAVVEAADAKYFFKMVGPSDQVAAARAAFDTMVRSVAPRTP